MIGVRACTRQENFLGLVRERIPTHSCPTASYIIPTRPSFPLLFPFSPHVCAKEVHHTGNQTPAEIGPNVEKEEEREEIFSLGRLLLDLGGLP